MLWRPIFLFIMLLFSCVQGINGQPLSEQSTINLLTCGPGKDLYSTFGHTAIYIRDPERGIDKVYNYGTFDFDTDYFYLKFCQGELNYFLNVTSFNQFANMYHRAGRWVHFQELNLTPSEANKVYAFLEENARGDNKFYHYKFFKDNCSTRPRNVFETVLGDKLVYQKSHNDSISYRHLIDQYLGNLPWGDFGIDIALGKPCDAIPNQRERMFLPDFLHAEFQDAKLINGQDSIPFVRRAGVILEQSVVPVANYKMDWIFWTIMVIAMLSALFLNPSRLRWFDISMFSIVGLLGISLILLWFATSHAETKWNFNILWATPSWLYGAYLLIRKRPSSAFFKVHGIIMFSIVVFWMFIPQDFHSAVIPIILTLAVRSWAWQKQRYLIESKS